MFPEKKSRVMQPGPPLNEYGRIVIRPYVLIVYIPYQRMFITFPSMTYVPCGREYICERCMCSLTGCPRML